MMRPKEGYFRVNFDGNGDVLSVEHYAGKAWRTVECNKEFPLKEPIGLVDMKTINIMLGRTDPCVEVCRKLYCWK